MPGTNVTDVNISGGNNEQMQTPNNGFSTSVVEPVMSSTTNVEIPTAPIEPRIEQPFVESQQINNQVVSPIQAEPQVIPTVSIDDVLAKANQPSVVGNQAFADTYITSNNQMGSNIQMNNNINSNNDFVMPNLSPINEEPTSVSTQNEFSIPDLNSINESNIEVNKNNSIGTVESGVTNPVESNVNINGTTNIGMPNLNPISENPESIDDFLNSVNSNTNQTVVENNQIDKSDSINTFAPFNLNRDDNVVTSPINTSPIIDTTGVNNQNNVGLDSGIDNMSTHSIPEPQQQFERVPEPIIVNDYNDQYAPIMPKQQNQQPTIDFKTIISLIRKCSQAIENSGYKIETEEYNLDNLYQVVFKIEKQ